MRPRKKILFISDRPDSISSLKMLLEIRGKYRFLSIPSSDALCLMEHDRFDLVMMEVFALSGDAITLTTQIKSRFIDIPVLLFSREVNDYSRVSIADYFIPEQFCTAAEVLSRVAIMVQWKRGPKGARHQAIREVGRKAAEKSA